MGRGHARARLHALPAAAAHACQGHRTPPHARRGQRGDHGRPGQAHPLREPAGGRRCRRRARGARDRPAAPLRGDRRPPLRVSAATAAPGGVRRARRARGGGDMTVVADELLEPIAAELQEFEQRLYDSIAADLGPMASAMEHIVKAGGKRLRPALVILSARLGRADRDMVFNLEMGIEFIHTATLVHDDLIDDSPTRRGIRTIHEALGPNPAIIIGDYYFAKGAHLLSAIGMPSIDSAISHAVMTICMGELLQMTSRHDYEQSIEDYHRKIERKTATLLSTCCYAGGLLSGIGPDGV